MCTGTVNRECLFMNVTISTRKPGPCGSLEPTVPIALFPSCRPARRVLVRLAERRATPQVG